MSDKAEKLYEGFKNSKGLNDIYQLIDGDESDMIHSLCGLLGGEAACYLLTSESLTLDEKGRMHKIREKREFARFLNERMKMTGDEFFKKIYELLQKSNPILGMRFMVLKNEKGLTWRPGN
ncbi:MAG: hypothetical protein EAZ08_00710 [Cytophagales bacterium]|nr:MAG: hypothetical protein EAZ08_00710 [Cytophagales bacterium]